MSLQYADALDGELINSRSSKHDLLAFVFHSLLSTAESTSLTLLHERLKNMT